MDSILKLVNTKDFTTNAILKKSDNDQSFTLDSVLKSVQTKTFSGDSILVNVNTKTFTSDSLLKKKDNEKTLTYLDKIQRHRQSRRRGNVKEKDKEKKQTQRCNKQKTNPNRKTRLRYRDSRKSDVDSIAGLLRDGDYVTLDLGEEVDKAVIYLREREIVQVLSGSEDSPCPPEEEQ